MIPLKEAQDIAAEYYTDNIHIGIFGSQSALEQGVAAKYAGFTTVLITQKGRDDTYVVHNKHLFDAVISVKDFKDALSEEVQEKLRNLNTIMLPNRSMVAYWEIENVENFEVPFYGARQELRAEERTSKPPANQYYLLEKSGVRMPKLFKSPDEIDCLVVVKAQQKDNPLERAYFYPKNPKEYYEMRDERFERGLISKEGIEKAAIEEFIIGPYLNANFHVFSLKEVFQNRYDLVGFSFREQTNESGFRALPASVQLALEDIKFERTNEEICHIGKTLRESKLESVYKDADKFFTTLEKELPPGHKGMIGLQGAVSIDKKKKPEFVIFDVSFRIPGDPAMASTSPFTHGVGTLTMKHSHILKNLRAPYGERRINAPLDLTMMEIEVAAKQEWLAEIVT